MQSAETANTQHTYVNTELAEKHGYTAESGMRDVTMGVLCTNTPEGLVYRARWKRRSVCVKVGLQPWRLASSSGVLDSLGSLCRHSAVVSDQVVHICCMSRWQECIA